MLVPKEQKPRQLSQVLNSTPQGDNQNQSINLFRNIQGVVSCNMHGDSLLE